MSVQFLMGEAAYRSIRFAAPVERLWSMLRASSRLHLPIGLELDISPNDLLIDCGGNVGDVTSRFARTGAYVQTFEPHPMCYSILVRRFAMMHKVKIFNVGVSDQEELLELRTPVHGHWDPLKETVAASFMKLAESRTTIRSETTARCIDLDEHIRQLGRRVRLLKLDVEGFEVRVLNRMLSSGSVDLVDLIVVETHERLGAELSSETDRLRKRIDGLNLTQKIRLDWP